MFIHQQYKHINTCVGSPEFALTGRHASQPECVLHYAYRKNRSCNKKLQTIIKRLGCLMLAIMTCYYDSLASLISSFCVSVFSTVLYKHVSECFLVLY